MSSGHALQDIIGLIDWFYCIFARHRQTQGHELCIQLAHDFLFLSQFWTGLFNVTARFSKCLRSLLAAVLRSWGACSKASDHSIFV